ncbi:MAG: exo-alpha-sialidase, partial [Thermoguttaceae bacterium]|nr:exo-alpha-sialidase [Thermoguttaceae bacterium]
TDFKTEWPARAAGEKGTWDDERFARWNAAHERISDAERKAEVGCWTMRSTDGGINWEARQAAPFNSPHGPTQLSDGRLLYLGKELWTAESRNGAAISTDDGQTWEVSGFVPTREGDTAKLYCELHAVEAADGTIVGQIRNHNAQNNSETLQTISKDGGKTWSTPRELGVWGLPSFLTRLADDRLLMTYGHRRAPLGVQARVSEDNGETWSEALVIYGDGTTGDLGYPSTVQLDDGSLYTVWYECEPGKSKASLRGTRWTLK